MEQALVFGIMAAVFALMVIGGIWAFRGLHKASPEIGCPNCKYVGRGISGASGGAQFLTVMLCVGLSLIFAPFLLLAVVLFLVFLFKPSRTECPLCHYRYPVPIEQWKSGNLTSGAL